MNEAGRSHRRPPSGEQYAIAAGSTQAHISEVGATLRSFTVDGHDVVDGFVVEERATDGRGQILAPWPNRLTDGSYRYGGRDCQAPLNEIARQDAIHGLVRWLAWTLVEHTPASVSLSCALRPQPGYEWNLDLHVTYAVNDAGLSATLQAVNADVEPAPFGAGFHPYLTLGSATIDDLLLTVPGTANLDRAALASQTTHDFRASRRIGSTQLDTAFSDLTRGADGTAVARLENPSNGRSVELWVDDKYRYLMVYTADRVGRPERRRHAVAIEPMTCPPEAFRTGTDLIELDPGRSWRGSWGLRIT